MKSHCVHGHELTPENTYTHVYGKRVQRQCRTCNSLNAKRRRDEFQWLRAFYAQAVAEAERRQQEEAE